MLKKIITLFLINFFVLGCTVTRVNSQHLDPVTKSFVKIIHTIEINSCVDKKDKKCPVGVYGSSGSGAAVDLGLNEMTVLTAGHVCDVRPTGKIDNYSQTVHVIDHNERMHQAWPIKVSFDDSEKSADLCILWVPTLKVKKLKVSNSCPQVGQELWAMAAPHGIYHPPTVPIFKGIFSGPVSPSSDLVTIPSAGGSSGGPVLTKNNKVVGVIFAANRQFHHVALMTNCEVFKLFLIDSKKTMLEIKKVSNTQ